ncbi:MAG: PTS sugar transporter subunit IIC [Arsenophonus sp.]|nr:MAG: PTS sugar transporter subunit IIC [Arsenophonus sp.]
MKLQNLFNVLPEVLTKRLNISCGIIVVEYSIVINIMRTDYLMPFFLFFVISAFTNFNLLYLGIISMVMSIIYTIESAI